MVLPPTLARLGDTMERRIAPRFYRRSRIVTLSESSRAEIVEMLRLSRARHASPLPEWTRRSRPGGHRSPKPLVVAVGRFVPVKRFDALLRALAEVKAEHPDLEAVIIGEGYERPALEALRAELGAAEWIRLPGHVSDDELVDWYRRAWVVAGSSQREGWGMTLTEAAACGTPAVATDIAGHARRRLRRRVGPVGRRPRTDAGRVGTGARRRGVAQPAVQGRPRPGRAGSHGTPRPAAPSRRWRTRRRPGGDAAIPLKD